MSVLPIDKSIPSPCIRNCCLDRQDICVGCFRSIDEILRWSNASFNQQQQIMKAAELRKNTRNKSSQQQ
ncbi:DUF1289 domain-containing protein [Aliiglaciecola sp. LCG003]|uniref:DUF1289 domain-containing protein n=1 Tax=Aliiglaciecola sp. LCG003 TaxID=3053655 RepID=UPI002573B863|nr:DUF1289 domain-containing protein [Aliiglaciecola sp. LCG003]WJG10829.1 DUF1289 domain-containing protein [Aliiglaciecola sp. LCG003]